MVYSITSIWVAMYSILILRPQLVFLHCIVIGTLVGLPPGNSETSSPWYWKIALRQSGQKYIFCLVSPDLTNPMVYILLAALILPARVKTLLWMMVFSTFPKVFTTNYITVKSSNLRSTQPLLQTDPGPLSVSEIWGDYVPRLSLPLLL